MIEWQKLQRSIRYENAEIAIDVWPYGVANGQSIYSTTVRRYRFTAFDKVARVFIGSGTDFVTEDEACESAMKMARI